MQQETIEKFKNLGTRLGLSLKLTDREKKGLLQFIEDTLSEPLTDAYAQKVYMQLSSRVYVMERKNELQFNNEELTNFLSLDAHEKSAKYSEALSAAETSFAIVNNAFKAVREKSKAAALEMPYFDYLWHELAVASSCYKYLKNKINGEEV